MAAEPSEPSDVQAQRARSRMVPYDSVKKVIAGLVRGLGEEIREIGGTRFADGGCVRAVPLNDDGVYSGDAQGKTIVQFLSTTFALLQDVERLESMVIDWSECPDFKNIL